MFGYSLMKPILLSAARHLATAAGGALATYGVIATSQSESVAGAIMVLVGVALGAVDKIAAAKK
jgi:hypothetical protein